MQTDFACALTSSLCQQMTRNTLPSVAKLSRRTISALLRQEEIKDALDKNDTSSSSDSVMVGVCLKTFSWVSFYFHFCKQTAIRNLRLEKLISLLVWLVNLV